ncbi:MAG: hypothetical protein RIQ53_723 [Pseudomonadota bacterium]
MIGVPAQERPTRQTESDVATRLREVMGDEPHAAFARRCGVGETTLRKYLAGADPSTSRLVAMADAARVNLEWLATGRGPKVRSTARTTDAQTMSAVVESRPTFDDIARLTATIAAVQEGLVSVNLTLPPAKYAELVAAAYELMGGGTEAAQPQSAHVVRFIRAAAR